MEKIAEVVDTLDSLIAAMSLKMPAEIHLTALREALPELRDKLKAAYLSTGGEDVWEDD